MNLHDTYMFRCLALAKLGMGRVAPNPMVGSILVFEDRIIGEGYHQQYGEAHAEVNCLQSVKLSEQRFISQSTLYVSLEPCAHFGKTPPCADLIINKKIPRVVVGCRDPFEQVNGKGIEKLEKAGIEVIIGIMEKECLDLNKRFFAFHTKHRPFILLKWAQTGDGKIANDDYSRVFISNQFSNRLTHKWRSEEMAIVVGTNTALFDDPELNTRLWPGANPVRIVVDMNLRLPKSLKLFDGNTPTIVFNLHKHTLPGGINSFDVRQMGLEYYQVLESKNLVQQLVDALYKMGVQSILVEGGTKLLKSFIDEGMWDEARVITNEELKIVSGIAAPVLVNEETTSSQKIFSDVLRVYKPKA